MKVIGSILIRAFLILLILAAVLLAVLLIAYFHRSKPSAVRKYETTNPHIAERTQVSAHRCGAGVKQTWCLAALSRLRAWSIL